MADESLAQIVHDLAGHVKTLAEKVSGLETKMEGMRSGAGEHNRSGSGGEGDGGQEPQGETA